jgi:hypothetical protein
LGDRIVTRCDLTAPDATCPRCGFVSKVRGAIRQCRAPATTHCGPGCQLRRTFAWFGIRDDGSCGCDAFAAKMDAWGPACWDHIEEIVDHLREAAAKRGLPFLATAARIAVARAIQAGTPPAG